MPNSCRVSKIQSSKYFLLSKKYFYYFIKNFIQYILMVTPPNLSQIHPTFVSAQLHVIYLSF